MVLNLKFHLIIKMDIETSIQNRLSTIFRGFLHNIANHYKLDFNELCTFVETTDFTSATTEPQSRTCMHRMTRGINKGNLCSKKALENGYCGRHQNSASITIGNIIGKRETKNSTKPKKMTKTQLQIIDWLNTAVPQEETVVKKRSKGLLHEETDIIFSDNFIALGRLEGSEIVKLTSFEVEICEKHGWKYDENAIEVEDE